MNTYTLRQYLELFHLLFLSQLVRKLDKKLYALKGGCNMRFFFKSPRYSEDIDLDVQSISVDVIRKKVNSILNSRPFTDILQVRNIEIEHITEHKQTETTQRWKLGLIVPYTEKPLPTKIEFSRRGLENPIKFESISPEILQTFKLSPIMANHYPAEITCQQKLRAIISRSTPQARDIFDLYILLASRAEKVDLPEDLRSNLNKVKESILSMGFVIFKSQVISYLEPEDQHRFESEEAWDNIRLCVVETLGGD
ncbi:MAG: nucleotidyl transferase AbiEii/AbiGii toxin family protein [Candidatus Aminicenantaceae bacterium]